MGEVYDLLVSIDEKTARRARLAALDEILEMLRDPNGIPIVVDGRDMGRLFPDPAIIAAVEKKREEK